MHKRSKNQSYFHWFDGTLMQGESIDELAQLAHKKNEVSKITAAAIEVKLTLRVFSNKD